MPPTGTVSPHDQHGVRQDQATGLPVPARPRLAARLDRFAELMVLRAPPGFGKTTVLDRWVAGRERDGLATRSYRGTAWQPADLVELTGGVLVVDDVDQPLGPDRTAALLALMEGGRPLRVVIAGRDVEDLRRSAWRRGVQVATLGPDVLAATPAELAEMARDWGHDLSTGRVKELHAATGGWPGVARQVLDATDHGAHSFDLDDAGAYLGATVLDALSEPVRHAAGVLALAAEITDCHLSVVAAAQAEPAVDERELVTALEDSRLLQRRDGSVGWTMLPVARHAVLAGRYGPAGPVARQWHAEFARALRDADEETNVPQILRHARAGEDWEGLSQIWTRYGMGLLDRCHDEVVEAYQDLPQPVLARWSYLSVPVAVVAWATEQRPYADVHRAFCNSLRPLASAYRDNAEEPMSLEDHLAGTSAVLITDRMDGRLHRALEAAARTHAQVAPMIADGPAPMRYAWFLMQWAMTALAAADWPRAVQLFSRGFDAAHATRGAEFVAASCAANAALLTAFDGSTSDARHWLTQYQHFADPTSRSHGHFAKAAHLAEALLAMDALDAEGTAWHLQAAGDLGTDLELWPCNLYVRSQQALIFGDPVGMLSRLDQVRTTHPGQAGVAGAGSQLLHRMEADLLLAIGEVNRAHALLAERPEPWLATARARLHLITGDAERARSWASSGTWDPAVTARDRLDRLLIHAVAADQEGLAAVADQAFRQAGALAAQIGTLRGYPLVPRGALDRLLSWAPGVLTGQDLDRVRSARHVYPEAAALVALSEREQVVLEQLSRFESIRQVAAALTVSPNTVKKQVVAVYAKLGVHDRETALLEGRRLGLLAK